jgi:glyoxylase-like metal-dependent hydrolase (beta-lactamase superfamily II)
MQEIAPKLFIETAYPGVTVAGMGWSHGMFLIDAPLRPEDTRSWRAALLSLRSGPERWLVSLDTHLDRTLGTRSMDCTVIAQEKVIDIFRSRPVSFKPQVSETGSEWELFENLSSVRWIPPEITFSQSMQIHSGENEILLESRPASASGALWVTLKNEGVVFIGDAVVVDQPPFLAGAEIPAWIENLQTLLSSSYKNKILISGRGGMINADRVKVQIKFLEKAESQLRNLADHQALAAETEKLVHGLLKNIHYPSGKERQYYNRLKWGLHQVYLRHYTTSGAHPQE